MRLIVVRDDEVSRICMHEMCTDTRMASKKTSIRGLEVLSFPAGNQRSYPCSSVLYVQ